MKFLIILTTFLAVANAKCADLSVVKHFNSTRYLGTWYEHARTQAASAAEWFGSCSKAEYTKDKNSNTIHVVNSDKLFSKTIKLEGYATLSDPSKTEAKLNVTLKTPVAGMKTTYDWILATDYETFAISYNCRTVLDAEVDHTRSIYRLRNNMNQHSASENFGVRLTERHDYYVWLLSRKQVLGTHEQVLFNLAVNKAFEKIEAEGGPKLSSLKLTNQKNC